MAMLLRRQWLVTTEDSVRRRYRSQIKGPACVKAVQYIYRVRISTYNILQGPEMARLPGILVPGLVLHIIQRGNR
jgi:hypothetical protein